MRLYPYIGPEAIRSRVVSTAAGEPIRSAADLLSWFDSSGQQPDATGLIGVTFVIDPSGVMCVADRRSEHVACAGGGPVRSAGEMFFRRNGSGVELVEVSNQSTGFCPEPESWPAVAAALDAAGIPHPGGFTQSIIFRRCPRCGQRNIVKDGWFVCSVCASELPREWNFAG